MRFRPAVREAGDLVNTWMSRRSRRSQDGFTLVELLVVIVILGVLAGVVVFAVRGSGDKGKQAAVATDERIIRTALETYCAQKGHYPDEPAMDTLVGERFLASPSTYHRLETGDDLAEGNCPGTPKRYRIIGDLPALPVGKWFTKPPGDLPIPHQYAVAVTLPDGRLLRMTSAIVPHSTEFYDVASKGWLPGVPAPPDVTPLTILAIGGALTPGCPNCGKVLVHGSGVDERWALFDPNAQTWVLLPPNSENCFHGTSLTLLGDNTVLVAGCGRNGMTPDTAKRAEIFDPRDPVRPWKPTTPMEHAHRRPLTVGLSDGRALVVGGGDVFLGNEPVTYRRAEIYNPVDRSWTSAGQPSDGTFGQDGASATLLKDGRALFIGLLGHTQIYDPGTNSWSSAPNCPCGRIHTATRLDDGKVLVVGGKDAEHAVALFDPASNSWAPAEQLPPGMGRHSHVAGLLSGSSCGNDCGKVIVAGGTPAAIQTSTLMFSEKAKPPGER